MPADNAETESTEEGASRPAADPSTPDVSAEHLGSEDADTALPKQPEGPDEALLSQASAGITPEQQATYGLKLRISQFQWTIDALRELVDVVLPHAAQLDKRELAPTARDAIQRLSKEQRQALADTLKDAFDDSQQTDEPLGRRVFRVFGSDYEGFSDFAKGFTATIMSPGRAHLVGASLLTSAVGAFEVLVAGVVGAHFRFFPTALDEEHKEFSLEDLRGFDTIRDAEAEAIDRRTTRTMRDGFEEWKKWLAPRLNCDFSSLVLDEAQLTEIFQRRHAIVHNAGRVSKHYLNAVGPDDPPAIGSTLRIDAAYLGEALDALNVAGLAIGMVAAAKWAPGERDDIGEDGADRVYSLLREHRFLAAARLAEIVRPLVKQQGTRQSLAVNTWIARKRALGPEAIADEVAKWDTSALDARFRLAQLTLSGVHEKALDLLSDLVADGSITDKNLNEWPLFDELRGEEAFQKLLSSVPGTDAPTDSSDDDALTRANESAPPSD